jgi:glycosyltransferase involved in cell wall biosynthesis
VRVRSTSFERRKLWLRALNYATYLVQSLREALAVERPDVVLTMTDPPLVGVVAAAVASRFRAPLVAVSQDVFPDVAVALGQLRNPLVAALLRRLATIPLQRAARVVAIGETMKRRLEAKGAAPERVTVIGNWADTDALTPAPRNNGWSAAHGLDDKFVVMHSGNVGYAQDLDTLVRAVAPVGGVRLVVVGDGARRADVEALARQLAIDALFLPYQPSRVLAESLSAADVHAVGLARGLAGLVVPSRLYGILAVGRAVLVHAEDESETAQVVREVGCGVVVPPGDPERLAEALRAVRDRDLDELGRRGREWVVANAGRDASVARYRAVLSEVRSAAGAGNR